MKIGFIADFFVEEIHGGGELNNEELIGLLSEAKHDVLKIKSDRCIAGAFEHFEENGYNHFIVANFVGLPEEEKRRLMKKKYIIYEHDHKYLPSRNPATYPNFLAPKEELINVDFYTNAVAVVCQSTFHKEIVQKNLGLDNIISVGGNLWKTEVLDYLAELAVIEKKPTTAVMASPIPHKNTSDALRFCTLQKIPYELIPSLPYRDFLERLGKNEAFVFFPKTPETLSRIVVEARMMGVKIITNKLVGATKEEWFKLKGVELVEEMRARREQILKTIVDLLDD
jgi:hypothetical protein